MTVLLHIDSSARAGRSGKDAHGSHTRRLTAHFVATWTARHPDTRVIYRDVGQMPPAPVTEAWIQAAFTPEPQREAWMRAALEQSDTLVDELVAADLIVAGVPMYNFGPPAQFKAYIDNIVRVGRTFGFDRTRHGEPYWPLLAEHGKRLVLVSSRGDWGYDPGGRLAHSNHVEASVKTAFAYIGLTDVRQVAAESDEFGDARQRDSLAQAHAAIERIVQELSGVRCGSASTAGGRQRAAGI